MERLWWRSTLRVATRLVRARRRLDVRVAHPRTREREAPRTTSSGTRSTIPDRGAASARAATSPKKRSSLFDSCARWRAIAHNQLKKLVSKILHLVCVVLFNRRSASVR
jgi:hypothetical protein